MFEFVIALVAIVAIVFMFGIYASKISNKQVNTDFPEWGVKILNHLSKIVDRDDDIYLTIYKFISDDDVSGLKEYLEDLYYNGRKYGLSNAMIMTIDWYISLLSGNQYSNETYIGTNGLVSKHGLN